ncbi:PIN domain-containing protein [Streptomyces olivaceoviridis]
MILIFDTNAVRMLNPKGSDADVLRIIKTSGTAKVAVPEMVLHEMIAQQVIEYRDAFQKAEAAVKRVRGRHPDSIPAFTDLRHERGVDFEDLRRRWEQKYRALFDIIPTTGDMALAALIREANGEKPAKMTERQGEKKKEGARDVAIWLSVVDYVRKNPQEQVHFVTNNTRDFGDGTEWPAPMSDDVLGVEDRLHILKDMDSVISVLTEKVQASELSAEASAALKALPQAIGDMAIKYMRGVQLRGSLLSEFDRRGYFRRITFRRWAAPPDAELLAVSNVTGHKIADSVWFVADVEWLLWGVAPSFIPNLGVVPIACIWETKVLMTTSGVERPTIVSDRPIVKRLDPEDRDRWLPVFKRAVGAIDELMAGEAQNLVSDLLLSYSDENRDLIANLATPVVEDEGGDS